MKVGEIWANDSIAILIIDKLIDDYWNVAPFGVYEDLPTTVKYIRSSPSSVWAKNIQSGNDIRKFYKRVYENR